MEAGFPIFTMRYANGLVGMGRDGFCQAISLNWNMLILQIRHLVATIDFDDFTDFTGAIKKLPDSHLCQLIFVDL